MVIILKQCSTTICWWWNCENLYAKTVKCVQDIKFNKEIVQRFCLLFLCMYNFPFSLHLWWQTAFKRTHFIHHHSSHQSLSHYDQPSVVVQWQFSLAKDRQTLQGKQMFTSQEYYLELCGLLPYQIDLSGHFSYSGGPKHDYYVQDNKARKWWSHLIASLITLWFVPVVTSRISGVRLRRTLTDASRKQGETLRLSSLTSHWQQSITAGLRDLISAAKDLSFFLHSSLSLQTPEWKGKGSLIW